MSTSNSKKAVYLGLGGLTVAVGGYLIYNQLNKSEDKGYTLFTKVQAD